MQITPQDSPAGAHSVTVGCRLCGGHLTPSFTKQVLRKYKVAYYKCEACLSLQTELPYWLNEAYQNNNLSTMDTGSAQRNLINLAACYLIAKLLKARNVLDIGGGDGLLCRLLRDYSINCFVKDKYAIPTYGQGFTEPNFTTPDLVLGFEVLEHFANPVTDLELFFSYQPPALLFSTLIYSARKKQDWWYFVPETGQHVFFYSKPALSWIAKKYGYDFVKSGAYILFVKKRSLIVKVLAPILLNKIILRLARLIILLLPTTGVTRDQKLYLDPANLS